MPLTLVPLPADHFDRWLQRSTREYIADLVATGHSEHQAATAAHQTMRQAFPEGKPTGSNSVFHVLDETLGVVGYLWIGRDTSEDPSSWWIWDVLIEEKFRGRGFGKATMPLAEEHARSQGANTLGLNVFGFNKTARGLYESIGYETTSLKMRKVL